MQEHLEKHRYLALDGLRGVVAISVLLYHLTGWTPGWLFADGYLAVDFFFCLSGFVIAQVYKPRLVRGLDLTQFIRIRLIRLYPMFAVGLAFGAGIYVATHGLSFQSITDIVLTGLWLPSPNAAALANFPANPPVWSLFFELCVNVAYVTTLPVLGRRAILAILVVSFACLATLALDNGVVLLGSTRGYLFGGFPRAVYSFFAGVFISEMRSSKIQAPRTPAVVLVIIILAVLGIDWRTTIGAPIIDLFSIGVIFPAVVFFGADAVPAASWQRNISSILGEISYPLYAIHYPVVALLMIVLTPPGPFTFETGTAAIVSAVLVVIVSFLFARRIDAPLRASLMQARRGRSH